MGVVTSAKRRKLTPSEVTKLLEAGKTPRYRELERLQAYYESTQYLGLPSFFDRDSNAPRIERAPCVVYPLASLAIDSHVSYAMGGRRFPRVTSLVNEDDTSLDDIGLSPKDSEVIDGFNAKLIETCDLAATYRDAAKMALASKSVAVLWCYRNGLPTAEPVWSKLCTPTFDPKNPDEVIRLEIRYRYEDVWRDALITGGEWWPVVKEYLRVIDDRTDCVYEPAEIWDVYDPGPSMVAERTVHGFGECPVTWYAPFLPSKSSTRFDGCALADRKLGELDALNYALSARHAAAFYAGEPQLVGTGVDADDDLGAGGRTGRAPPRMPGEKPTQWDAAIYGTQGGSNAIRKGPGELWRTPNPEAKFYYLLLPTGALEAIDSHAKDMACKLREGLHYVWIDPEALTGSGDISGKTLAFVYASQTSFVDTLRGDLQKRLILPSLNKLYRLFLARSEGVYVPGLKKALPILAKFRRSVTDASSSVWFAPTLKLEWGAYFDTTEADDQARVTSTTAAKDGGLITLQSAVEHIAPIYGIHNASQYVEQLQQEIDEKAEKDRQAMVDTANDLAKTAMPKGDGGKPGVKPGGAKPDAKPFGGGAKK